MSSPDWLSDGWLATLALTLGLGAVALLRHACRRVFGGAAGCVALDGAAAGGRRCLPTACSDGIVDGSSARGAADQERTRTTDRGGARIRSRARPFVAGGRGMARWRRGRVSGRSRGAAAISLSSAGSWAANPRTTFV